MNGGFDCSHFDRGSQLVEDDISSRGIGVKAINKHLSPIGLGEHRFWSASIRFGVTVRTRVGVGVTAMAMDMAVATAMDN